VEVSNLDGLLVASPKPIEGLDQVKLKSQQFVAVGAVSVDVVLGHVLLALAKKPKTREPSSDNLHGNEGFQFRPTVGGSDDRQRSIEQRPPNCPS